MDSRATNRSETVPYKFHLDKVRLRFTDPAVEQRFVHDTLEQSLVFIRAYLIGGIIIYMVFGFLDRIVGGNSTTSLWMVRYGFVVPSLLSILIITFTPLFLRIAQPLLATAMIVSGMGIVAMTAIMEPPFNNHYYAGLIMALIYCGSLIRVKFNYSILISIAMVIAYQFVCIWINPIPFKSIVNNDFFLITATGIGLFSSYIIEMYMRNTYVAQQIIEAKNEETNALLIESDKASKSKSEFLATMSHELRTPLNAILGFSDILKKEMFGTLGNPRYVDYANDIHNSGAHLLSIINDILDLAKSESGKLQLNEDEVDTSGVLRDCLHLCREQAAMGKVDLTSTGIDEPVFARADERLLRQIILNLLSNAIKFTDGYGSVHIDQKASAECGITMVVSDTGAGIPAEDIERVLRPFEQVESALTRRHNGTGLGLPYAKRLVELHGGRLILESEVNVGTTVTIHLPPARLIGDKRRPALKEAV